MKRILLLPALFLSLQSFAQEPYFDFKKFKENKNGGSIVPLELSNRYKTISKDSLEKIIRTLEQLQYSPGFGKLVLTRPNGSGIYILPQDNMPCLVPDLSQFNMPVMGRGMKISGMPPDGRPPVPLIPPQDK